MVALQTVVVLLAVCSLHAKKLRARHKERQVSTDVCEYDIDLKRNTVRAKCQGQPLGVSVYAGNANVVTSRQGGDRGSGSAGGQPDLPAVSTTELNNASFSAIQLKLRGHTSAIGNISNLLSRGDNDLRSDLQALRSLAPDDSAVRESIIATMRNQYNFMRTAILAHNAELSQVLGLVDSLVSLTTSWLQATRQSHLALAQQVEVLNRTVQAMRATVSTTLRRQNRNRASNRTDQCPRRLSAVGGGDGLAVPWERGVVMTDASHSGDRIWIMAVDEERDQLLQYDSRIDIQYGLVSRYFSLPFYCEGTGHVVFRNALFCHKSGTRILAKYNLKRMEVAAEVEIPSAGVANTYPYQSGLKSDIDLAVDEMGLWAIYSTEESAGKMVISKLNPRSLVLEKTWLTSFPKKLVGNAFMVCGVLYATNSFQDTPTFVRYTYDTNNLQEAIHDSGNLIFNNAVVVNASSQAASVMLDYSPKEQKLYSWSHSQIQTFPVFFQKKNV